MQDIDSYKWFPLRQYFSNINFKYIFEESLEIPTHTYQTHNFVINIVNMQGGVPLVGGVGWKRPSSPRVNHFYDISYLVEVSQCSQYINNVCYNCK